MVLNSSSRVGGGYQFKPNKVYFGKIVEATIPLALEQHIRGKKQAHQAMRKNEEEIVIISTPAKTTAAGSCCCNAATAISLQPAASHLA